MAVILVCYIRLWSIVYVFALLSIVMDSCHSKTLPESSYANQASNHETNVDDNLSIINSSTTNLVPSKNTHIKKVHFNYSNWSFQNWTTISWAGDNTRQQLSSTSNPQSEFLINGSDLYAPYDSRLGIGSLPQITDRKMPKTACTGVASVNQAPTQSPGTVPWFIWILLLPFFMMFLLLLGCCCCSALCMLAACGCGKYTGFLGSIGNSLKNESSAGNIQSDYNKGSSIWDPKSQLETVNLYRNVLSSRQVPASLANIVNNNNNGNNNNNNSGSGSNPEESSIDIIRQIRRKLSMKGRKSKRSRRREEKKSRRNRSTRTVDTQQTPAMVDKTKIPLNHSPGLFQTMVEIKKLESNRNSSDLNVVSDSCKFDFRTTEKMPNGELEQKTGTINTNGGQSEIKSKSDSDKIKLELNLKLMEKMPTAGESKTNNLSNAPQSSLKVPDTNSSSNNKYSYNILGFHL